MSDRTPTPRETALEVVEDAIFATFWTKTDRRGADECWPWTGGASRDGRGLLSYRGIRVVAPRVALRLKTGVWPNKETKACHRCDNPSCVNPAHIWPGTQSENIKDAVAKGRVHPPRGWQRHKTHCKRGHEFTPENTMANGPPGHRQCRICSRAHKRHYEARKRAERRPSC